MTSAGRRVMRNRRFQILGAASLGLAAAFIVLTYIVIASPAHNDDHPSGFTAGGRVLTVGGCLLVVTVLLVMSVGSLRVALIIDEHGLVIRNPFRTTTVTWDQRPRFEIRSRRQDVAVESPVAAGSPIPVSGTITYRYREIVCVVQRQRIWIAATSKMRNRDRVEDTLKQLRDASGRRGSP